MLDRSKTPYWGVVFDTPDPVGLAHFYANLLGWKIHKENEGWTTVAAPDGVSYLGFQLSPEHVPPVWPPEEGRQQQMLHLDIEVGGLDAAVAEAVALGAALAGHQPQEKVRVLLDPAGHPFCLYVNE